MGDCRATRPLSTPRPKSTGRHLAEPYHGDTSSSTRSLRFRQSIAYTATSATMPVVTVGSTDQSPSPRWPVTAGQTTAARRRQTCPGRSVGPLEVLGAGSAHPDDDRTDCPQPTDDGQWQTDDEADEERGHPQGERDRRPTVGREVDAVLPVLTGGRVRGVRAACGRVGGVSHGRLLGSLDRVEIDLGPDEDDAEHADQDDEEDDAEAHVAPGQLLVHRGS